MRILVACEYSGRVRDAFARRGHDAWSCDLKPTEAPGNHIHGDALEALKLGWDMLIAHPPCTVLSYAGNGYLDRPGRREAREEALKFFMAFIDAPIDKICVENPMGYPQTAYRPADQIIHPYYFGEPHMKKTCLWLKNLPRLYHQREDDLFGKRTHTDPPQPIYVDRVSGKKRYFTDAISGTGGGGHARSLSFNSISEAMAEQWGKL